MKIPVMNFDNGDEICASTTISFLKNNKLSRQGKNVMVHHLHVILVRGLYLLFICEKFIFVSNKDNVTLF